MLVVDWGVAQKLPTCHCSEQFLAGMLRGDDRSCIVSCMAISVVIACATVAINHRVIAYGLPAPAWWLSSSVAAVVFTPTDNKQRVKQNPEVYTTHLAALSLHRHLQMYSSPSWLQCYLSCATGHVQVLCNPMCNLSNQNTIFIWSGRDVP